MTYLFSNN